MKYLQSNDIKIMFKRNCECDIYRLEQLINYLNILIKVFINIFSGVEFVFIYCIM